MAAFTCARNGAASKIRASSQWQALPDGRGSEPRPTPELLIKPPSQRCVVIPTIIWELDLYGSLVYMGARSKLLSDLKRSPGARVQIAQHALFPREFRMFLQMLGGLEVDSIGMAHGGGEGHPGDHRSVGGLILHGSRRPKRRLPRAGPARGKIDMAAQRPLAGRFFVQERVVMVG